jgi:hypothetical protein
MSFSFGQLLVGLGHRQRKTPNDCLQLRRAISIQAEGTRLLEEKCNRAVSCKALFDAAFS